MFAMRVELSQFPWLSRNWFSASMLAASVLPTVAASADAIGSPAAIAAASPAPDAMLEFNRPREAAWLEAAVRACVM
jgi:hypothetical protein